MNQISASGFPGFIIKTAYYIRSRLRDNDLQTQFAGIVDVIAFLVGIPFAAAGVIWLVSQTTWVVFRQEWPVLLVIAVLMLVFHRMQFFIITDLLSNNVGRANLEEGSEDIIVWSAVFLFGPTVLWLNLFLQGALMIWQLQGVKSENKRWNLLREAVNRVASGSFSPLVALAFYRSFGGTFPLPEVSLPLLGLCLATILIAQLIDLGIFWLGYGWLSFWIMHNIFRMASLWPVYRVVIVGVGVSFLAHPFSVLAAGQYVQNGFWIYLVFILGLAMVAYMGTLLSRAIESTRQQSLQLEKLEALGEAILQSLPDGSQLEAVLAIHVPNMFLANHILVWLAPDRILFKSPVDWDVSGCGAVQRFVEVQAGPLGFSRKQRLPWESSFDPHLPLVTSPILDSDTGKPIGGIYVELVSLGYVWDTKALNALFSTLQSLAAQVDSALKQARIYTQTLAHQKTLQELQLGRGIQRRFLPKELPEVPGWELVGDLQPARQVSGDFYDVIPLTGGRLGMLIADVADKGVGPALFMALSRTLIRTFATQYETDPAAVLKAANQRIISDAGETLFVTTFYGVLETTSGRLVYCNAGHNPPFWINGLHGEVTLLRTTGIPLGIADDSEWSSSEINLAAGDVLFMYTDGATDAQNSQGELFESERLLASTLECAAESAHRILTKVQDDIRYFTGEAPQFDDITLLVAKRSG